MGPTKIFEFFVIPNRQAKHIRLNFLNKTKLSKSSLLNNGLNIYNNLPTQLRQLTVKKFKLPNLTKHHHHTPPHTTTHHHTPTHTATHRHTPPHTTAHHHTPPHTSKHHHTPPHTSKHHH